MSTPNPATTPWVPMWNLNGGMDLRYQGAWAAGNYYDGDVVVYQGVTYICVRPTNKAPTPWAPGNLVVQPSVRVYRSTAQSVGSAWQVISFDTVRYDYGPAAHWNINNPTRLTAQVAGTYVIWGQVQLAAATAAVGSYRMCGIRLNGSMYISEGGPAGFAPVASTAPHAAAFSVHYLNAGDYVELTYGQDSGANVNTETGDANKRYAVEFSMALVGGMQGPPGLAANLNYGTTLPPSPADGQEAILVDSTTAPTYQWRFRYNAGHTGDANKWEYVGGAPAEVFDTADFTVPQNWNMAPNPQFTVPRAGLYTLETFVDWTASAPAGCDLWHGAGLASTGSAYYGSARRLTQGGNDGGGTSHARAGQSAGNVIRFWTYSTAAGTVAKRRLLVVTPVAVA